MERETSSMLQSEICVPCRSQTADAEAGTPAEFTFSVQRYGYERQDQPRVIDLRSRCSCHRDMFRTVWETEDFSDISITDRVILMSVLRCNY